MSKNQRIEDLLWKSERLLQDKIKLQDFAYIVQYAESVEEQDQLLHRVSLYSKARASYFNDYQKEVKRVAQNL